MVISMIEPIQTPKKVNPSRTIPISTRLEPETLKQIKTMLLKINYPSDKLINNAQILRAIVLYGQVQLEKAVHQLENR